MKIVSWNCGGATQYRNGSFYKTKQNYIKKYNADIYVIQECIENDIKSLDAVNKKFYYDNVDSEYGIGIFSDIFEIELLPDHNSDYRYVLRYKVLSDQYEFTLFAIWTKK
jgi:exonuclease III